MHKTTEKSLEKSIEKWIATRPDDVVYEHREGYYSYDIVCSAYSKGLKDGEAKGEARFEERLKEQIREKYFDKAQESIKAINELIDNINKSTQKKPSKIFMEHSIEKTAYILLYDETLFQDDTFVDEIYKLSAPIETKFFKEGELNVQISFMDDNEDTNYKLLASDGYTFGYDFAKGETIHFE
jgi:hypothetical protein